MFFLTHFAFCVTVDPPLSKKIICFEISVCNVLSSEWEEPVTLAPEGNIPHRPARPVCLSLPVALQLGEQGVLAQQKHRYLYGILIFLYVLYLGLLKTQWDCDGKESWMLLLVYPFTLLSEWRYRFKVVGTSNFLLVVKFVRSQMIFTYPMFLVPGVNGHLIWLC